MLGSLLLGWVEAGVKEDEAYLKNLRGAVGEDVGEFSKANKPVELAQKKEAVKRSAYDTGYELGKDLAKIQQDYENAPEVKSLDEMGQGMAVGKAVGSLTAKDGVLMGLGVFAYLLLIVMAVLWVFIPWMVYRIHKDMRAMLGVLKFQTKALEAMNTNLIAISQQINHFGSGQPTPRVHAPVPSARVEAPKNGLRR